MRPGNCDAAGVGVAVGVAVGAGVGDAVAVPLCVGDGVGVAVAVPLCVGVAEGLALDGAPGVPPPPEHAANATIVAIATDQAATSRRVTGARTRS